MSERKGVRSGEARRGGEDNAEPPISAGNWLSDPLSQLTSADLTLDTCLHSWLNQYSDYYHHLSANTQHTQMLQKHNKAALILLHTCCFTDLQTCQKIFRHFFQFSEVKLLQEFTFMFLVRSENSFSFVLLLGGNFSKWCVFNLNRFNTGSVSLWVLF